MKTLVIVESPTKAKTISRFLDKNFTIKSSYGHLRDLPKSTIGVDIAHNFKPEYIIPKDNKKLVTEIKTTAGKSDEIILATDEDREGEAIAWHLAKVLNLPPEKIKRITFHEITKDAITEALQHPRKLNTNLVNAQQARRILDRLVGYKLSPFLWKKVLRGLSAGRVQSVAVRLIVERERERKAFKQKEYWTIKTLFSTKNNETFTGELSALNGKPLKKFDLINKKQVDGIVSALPQTFTVATVEAKAVTKKPFPPFTTSTLQQAANRRFGFSARQTMRIAQQLYEGIALQGGEETGLITYMRTDSLNLSKEFIKNARSYIKNECGAHYLPETAVLYKAKSKLAQEAHEAIRPTNVLLLPSEIKTYLTEQQSKLYELIWQRAVASQMNPAKIKQASINVCDEKNAHTFRSTGQMLDFDGYLKIWPSEFKETVLPNVTKKDGVEKKDVQPEQHFTEPPARYSDASLVKALEEHDIGRPSTYAPTIATIIDRGYVEREKRRLRPTDIAFLVTELLEKHFTDIVDYTFTANMEHEFDAIANGKSAWQPVIEAFYKPFEENLKHKEASLTKKEITEEKTNKTCPECGKPFVIKLGRFGKFYACTGYPECKHTSPLEKNKKENKKIDQKCPECGKELAVKHGRFGEFVGCSGYPDCRYISNAQNKLGVSCPMCGNGEMVSKKTRRGKPFYACNQYPKCTFALWQKPTGEKCPECSSLLVYGGKTKVKCSNKSCKFEEEIEPEKKDK